MLDKSRQGTRNRAAGNTWNRACVIYLRRWWPTAERQLHSHRSDVGGIGDLAIECTIEPWAQIWKKLRQAEADSGGLPFMVWKKHNRAPSDPGDSNRGEADPGEAAVVFRARTIFPLLARLEQLELDAAEAKLGPEIRNDPPEAQR